MDTVKLTIDRPPTTGTPTYYATLRHYGSMSFGRLKRSLETVSTDTVVALQHSYYQQLELMHELATSGLAAPPLDMRQLLDLGHRVSMLLPRVVRQELMAAVQCARRHHRRLRIILEVAVEAIDLLAVPWELMVLASRHDGLAELSGAPFLLLDTHVALIRQVRGLGEYRPPSLSRPLAPQVFAAAPTDGRPLDLDTTCGALVQALSSDQVAHFWYAGASTLVALYERLHETRPEIVHLLCHGEQHDTGRDIRSDLLFTQRDGLTQRVGAYELGPALTLTPNLQLVVLQTCYSGAIKAPTRRINAERRAIASLALALVRQGVPAVIAMQGEIEQAAAATFVRACYRALAWGDSLEQAVTAGRIAMWSAGSCVDWSVPVIYQGSSQADPIHWSIRLQYRFTAVIQEVWMRWVICGGVVTLALASVGVKLLGWMLIPARSIAPGDLILPLVLWSGTGTIGPILAIAHGYRAANRRQLPSNVRAAVLRASLIGAYLAYIISGVLSLQLLAVFWICGLVGLLSQPGTIGLLITVLVGSLSISLLGARSQVRTALTMALSAPELFDQRMLRLVLSATSVFLAAHGAALVVVRWPIVALHASVLGAVTLALALLFKACRSGM